MAPATVSILFLAPCPIRTLFLLISFGEYKYFISKIKTNIFSLSTPYLSYTKGSLLYAVSAPGFFFPPQRSARDLSISVKEVTLTLCFIAA